MNTILHHFKKLLTISIFLLAVTSFAQSPQYYNYAVVENTNYYPFGVLGGERIQWLYPSGNFNQPSAAPSGIITKIYIFMGNNGSATVTNLTIKMGLATITSFSSGAWYSGQLDTVFYRASLGITSTSGQWMSFTLDHPYAYDNTKSLIVDIQQCSSTSNTPWVSQHLYSNNIRNYSFSSSCPCAYYGQNNYCANFGVDISISSGNAYYFTQWCPANTFPVLPSMSCYGSSALIGDTIYFAVASTDASTASALVYRYTISGNSWSPGTPLPSAHCQATLTACNGKLYHIGGGTTAGTATTDVYEYSPATGQWVTKSPIPEAKSGHSAVCWGDSVIVIAGGPWASPDANVYCFRPALNSWASCTSLSGGSPTRSQAGGIVANKIYLAGGYPFTNQLLIGTLGSDATQITWAAGPPYPSCGKSRIGGVGVTDRFYIIGGNNSVGTTSSDSTFVFNVNTNTWSALGSVKPSQVHNVSNAVIAWRKNDTIRVACIGGSSGSVNATNSFDVIGCGTVIVGVPKNPVIPKDFVLKQNYPNPFNPTTKIEFSIPKAGNVELKIYDLTGREVATLLNEFKTAGNYFVEFNATNFASGVYFYTLKSGEFRDTKKMMLIK